MFKVFLNSAITWIISHWQLLLITAIGGVIFMAGANWGLPVRLHPDEFTITQPTVEIIKNQTFLPNTFAYPAHTIILIDSLVYRLVSLVANIPLSELIANQMYILVLASRIVTGLFAASSVIMAYMIGLQRNRSTALISALLIVFFPLFTAHSHYATTDIPITFFMLLFIYFAILYFRSPDYIRLSLLSVTIALFIATKYPGAILCAALAITIIICSVRDKRYANISKHGGTSIFLILLSMFIISPNLFIKYKAVIKAFTLEARNYHLGADELGFIGNLFYYFMLYLSSSGILLFLFFLLGCYTLWIKKERFIGWIALFYSFVYWLCLSYISLHWERWSLPMWITPLLISAIGINSAWALLDGKRRIILLAVLSVIAINLLMGTMARLLPFLLPDTRVIAMEYCKSNGISKENAFYESYTPFSPSGGSRMDFLRAGDKYFVKNRGIEYVILSSAMYNRYYAERQRYPKQAAFYDFLASNFKLIKRFGNPSERTTVTHYQPSIRYSAFEGINIYRTISYIANTLKLGYDGPELLFYKVPEEFYLPNE
ncbi:MAG: glycosyltransferase family 39 protein [Deferribacteraceae bacterium]|jgi:hypothetical protein|nr:glycosyltransferase family 39 protein [Deferribacteraceae bacterium]